MEILGMVTLKINDGDYGRINIVMDHKDNKGVQFQVGIYYYNAIING